MAAEEKGRGNKRSYGNAMCNKPKLKRKKWYKWDPIFFFCLHIRDGFSVAVVKNGQSEINTN